ncbi:Hypothetical predicted protein [Olea europaea subsp. europaea]|uniref:Uncharacterized protein n=1 Tax=Olea europaea subsp. europaea TaxID=158383 RepID=A0A8S0SSL8_OLEEU|nr:Hypothetical predicted protein [Olea europaea subsp. europaea]
MATPASHLIQDQNHNILSKGATLGGKTGVTKADKKEGLGGRKALNDISNSRNATVLRTKKDLSVSKTKSVVGGKMGGRKVLGDLTNSVKPSLQAVPKKGQKLNPVAEENVPVCIEEEGILHNHHECIKVQRKAVDVDYLTKSVIGLDNDVPMWPSSPRAFGSSSKPSLESPVKHLEMEEIPELLFGDQISGCRKTNIPGCSSPSWGSPKSPKLPFTNRMDFCDFVLMESPKLLNP